MNQSHIKFAVAIVLSAFAITRAEAQSITVHTLAGNGTVGATNGFGSNARFNRPGGVAADNFGNIYVADTENGTVRKITPDGFVSTLAGVSGSFGAADGNATQARFYGLQGIAADNAGQLWVADSANGTIRKVSAVGTTSTFAGVAGDVNSFDGSGANARLYHPEGVIADGASNLYVADTWNHTIRKITPAGMVSTLAGLAGNPGAADGTNSKARFNRPSGIALDSSTNVYVADSLNHTVRKITPPGLVSTVAGMAGVWGAINGTNSSARFYLPEGIGVATNGEIYVADSGNQLIRKISPAGTNWVVSTVAGSSGLAGNTNGIGPSARFYFPAGLAMDNAGNLYAADTGNYEIRTTRLVPPTLQSTTTTAGLILSWPTSADGFLLEQTPVLGPAAAWTTVASGIVTIADNYFHTNALNGTAFYRLRHP